MFAALERLLAIGSAFLVIFAEAAQVVQLQLEKPVPVVNDVVTSVTPVGEEDARLSTVLDSRGVLTKGLLRREQLNEKHEERRQFQQWKSTQALLTEIASSKSTSKRKEKSTDLYVLVGKNLCDGGGLWKRYELKVPRQPGRYDYCAAACDDKEECVGFDVGRPGCNLYTQKAVALGTWPGVRFNDAAPFFGQAEHNAFPQTPADLVAGTSTLGADEMYQCYRKTYYRPADSYYWLIGHGTCSGGGLWKRYIMTPGEYSTCENACNQRDECIGFDVGTWQVSDNTVQVQGNTFKTSMVTTTGCFMYTQKAVYGTWPLVQDNSNLQDGEGDHDKFPISPYELATGYVARYEVGNQTKCYGKTHWVGLDEYFMLLGQQFCSGGGEWKHYKAPHATLEQCKTFCDMKDSCIGLDHEEGGECRLYTRIAITKGSWPGVSFGPDDEPFAGQGIHDRFAPTPVSLLPDSGEVPSRKCYAKTHYETQDQTLGDADTR